MDGKHLNEYFEQHLNHLFCIQLVQFKEDDYSKNKDNISTRKIVRWGRSVDEALAIY